MRKFKYFKLFVQNISKLHFKHSLKRAKIRELLNVLQNKQCLSCSVPMSFPNQFMSHGDVASPPLILRNEYLIA